MDKRNEKIEHLTLNINTKYYKALNGIKREPSIETNYGVGNDAVIKDQIARAIKTIDSNEFVLDIIKYIIIVTCIKSQGFHHHQHSSSSF